MTPGLLRVRHFIDGDFSRNLVTEFVAEILSVSALIGHLRE